MWPTYLEGMEGIVSSNIQRGTARVVAQSSVCPQDVAHVLWVVLANALLQVISSSLQQSSTVIIACIASLVHQNGSKLRQHCCLAYKLPAHSYKQGGIHCTETYTEPTVQSHHNTRPRYRNNQSINQ